MCFERTKLIAPKRTLKATFIHGGLDLQALGLGALGLRSLDLGLLDVAASIAGALGLPTLSTCLPGS